jgi:hypothetical protein
MAVDSTIDSLKGANTLLAIIFVFFSVDLAQNIFNLWNDSQYNVQAVSATATGDQKSFQNELVQRVSKAREVAVSMRHGWWILYGVPAFFIFGRVFLAMSFYQVLFVYGTPNPGTDLTFLFALLFVVVVLDKLLPGVYHRFTYSAWSTAMYVVSALIWAYALAITIVTWYYANTMAGGLLLGYVICLTVLSFTMWITFWYRSSTKGKMVTGV